jgi:hypothetical protein
LRNIDPGQSLSAFETNKFRKRETVPTLRRRIGVLLAVAGLCAAVAGCVSDMGAPTAENSGSSQLRYSGGPKYPMWSGQ